MTSVKALFPFKMLKNSRQELTKEKGFRVNTEG